jgi:hypothetical protein
VSVPEQLGWSARGHHVGAESAERRVGHPPDLLGAAVQPDGLAVFDLPAELGGNDDLVPDGGEGFAEEFLVEVGAVDLGGVEEGDPEVDRLAQDGDHGAPAAGVGPVALGHAHGAEADGRDL